MTSHYQWDIIAQTKHAPTSAERRFAPVRALYATPPGFAFTFWGRFPGFRPLRGSTAGLLYGAPPGLKFRHTSNFRFIERMAEFYLLVTHNFPLSSGKLR